MLLFHLFPSLELFYVLNHEYQVLLGKFHHGSYFPSSLSVAPLVFTAFSLPSPGFLWDGFGLTSFLCHEGNQPMAVLSLYWDQPDGRDVPEARLQALIHVWSRGSPVGSGGQWVDGHPHARGQLKLPCSMVRL